VVRFEPIVNLGNVLLQQSVGREIVFENVSDLPTTVSLAAPRDASLSLSLTRFDLKPGAKGVVRMQVTPKALGPLRELVKVKVGGALEDFQIDIAAKVIEQHLVLLSANKDGILDCAKFGELFFGQTRTINALLVNNGEHRIIVCKVEFKLLLHPLYLLFRSLSGELLSEVRGRGGGAE
jgi:hypothetical protein